MVPQIKLSHTHTPHLNITASNIEAVGYAAGLAWSCVDPLMGKSAGIFWRATERVSMSLGVLMWSVFPIPLSVFSSNDSCILSTHRNAQTLPVRLSLLFDVSRHRRILSLGKLLSIEAPLRMTCTQLSSEVLIFPFFFELFPLFMCSRQKSTISFVSLQKIDIGRCIARWFQSAEGKGDAERLGLNLSDGMCTFLFFFRLSAFRRFLSMVGYLLLAMTSMCTWNKGKVSVHLFKGNVSIQ